MKYIAAHTCVRFVERSHQKDFIFIYNGVGCSSNLGKIGGQQNLSLQKFGCFYRGTITHELIHALGYGKIINLIFKLNCKSFHRSHAQSRRQGQVCSNKMEQYRPIICVELS